MGIRITEVSTPLGGLAWEYTDKAEKRKFLCCPHYNQVEKSKYLSVQSTATMASMTIFVKNLKKRLKKPVWQMCISLKVRVLHPCLQVLIMYLRWRIVISAFS